MNNLPVQLEALHSLIPAKKNHSFLDQTGMKVPKKITQYQLVPAWYWGNFNDNNNRENLEQVNSIGTY